jgi:hypothetical protein
MKPISIITSLKKEKCVEVLLSNISVKDKNYLYFVPSILKKEEIIGNVSGTKFWLRKTKPSVYYGLFRIFLGRMISESGNTKIVGRFRFPLFIRMIDIMLFFGLFAILLFSGTIYELPLLITVILIIGYHYLNILINKKQEMAIVEFLKALYNDK